MNGFDQGKTRGFVWMLYCPNFNPVELRQIEGRFICKCHGAAQLHFVCKSIREYDCISLEEKNVHDPVRRIFQHCICGQPAFDDTVLLLIAYWPLVMVSYGFLYATYGYADVKRIL